MNRATKCILCGYPDVPAPPSDEDVRRGLAIIQRSLDEEGWAIGLRGAAICYLAGQMGQEQQEREET